MYDTIFLDISMNKLFEKFEPVIKQEYKKDNLKESGNVRLYFKNENEPFCIINFLFNFINKELTIILYYNIKKNKDVLNLIKIKCLELFFNYQKKVINFLIKNSSVTFEFELLLFFMTLGFVRGVNLNEFNTLFATSEKIFSNTETVIREIYDQFI